MKIAVYVSDKTAVLSGCAPGWQSLEISEVPDALRPVMADCIANRSQRPTYEEPGTVYLNSSTIDVAPTPESVLAACERILAERQAMAARQAQQDAEALADCIADIEAWVTKPTIERLDWRGQPTSPAPYRWSINDLRIPAELRQRAATALAEANALAAIRNTEKEAEKEARREAFQAEADAREGALRTWALEHGSDLLRARIAEGFKWRSLASTEYFALHTPDGFTTKSGADEVDERKYPDLSEIQALRTFQAALMPPLTCPRLVWCKVEEVEDEDTGEITPAEAWAALAVTITSPFGESTTIYRRF